MNEQPNAVERVETSVQCIKCAYDLVGQPLDGVCPECGAPVTDTLRGTLITNARPEYLARLHRGVFFALAGLVMLVLGFLVSFGAGAVAATGGADPDALPLYVLLPGSLLIMLSSVAGLVGWWMLTTPDPDYTGSDTGETPRILVRIAVAAKFVLWVIQLGTTYMPVAVADAAGGGAIAILSAIALLGGYAAFALQFFASMFYLKWLGRRVPNRKIVKRAGRLLWLGPLIFILGLPLLAIGPLIALVLYYNLLDWLRKDLKAIRAQQPAAA